MSLNLYHPINEAVSLPGGVTGPAAFFLFSKKHF